MKTALYILIIFTALFREANISIQFTSNTEKDLIVSFSRKGSICLDGDILNLKVGNMEAVAKKIHCLAGCDQFQCETKKECSQGYIRIAQVAQKEKRTDCLSQVYCQNKKSHYSHF